VGDGIYRDALFGMRARLDRLDIRIADREARTSHELVQHLPARLRERIRRLSRARRPRAETFEELTRAESDSASYLEALEVAHALAPELEAELRAIPDVAPGLRRFGRRGVFARIGLQPALDEVLIAVNDVLTRVVSRHDPAADVVALEDFAFAAQLRAADSPIALLVECLVDPERICEPRVQVATTVARATPHVALTPETWGHTLAKAVGMRRDVALGDESFDGRFLVDADPGAARRILRPELRAALLAIARDDVPALRIREGEAVLSWSFEPSDRALDAAFFILGRLRAMRVEPGLRG
jgi:hypothetical protein